VQHKFKRAWVGNVQRVTAASEVQVLARVVRIQPVVSCVVESAQTQRWSVPVTLSCVVVYNVQYYLDSRSVQRFYHVPEFVHLLAAV
jgi:hypothetical protein